MVQKKGQKKAPDKAAAEYYDLKSSAVDELINANVTNTPEIDPRELKKYRSRRVKYFPDGLKFFLLKWWFAGVVCWFFMIGLGSYGIAALDMMIIMGVVTGLVWDLPVNIIIRMRTEKQDFGRYMMFPKTGVAAGLLNVLFGLLLVYLTAQTYAAVAMGLKATGSDSILSVGPIFFGLFTAAWDWILLRFKKLGSNILADAKKNAAGQKR